MFCLYRSPLSDAQNSCRKRTGDKYFQVIKPNRTILPKVKNGGNIHEDDDFA